MTMIGFNLGVFNLILHQQVPGRGSQAGAGAFRAILVPADRINAGGLYAVQGLGQADAAGLHAVLVPADCITAGSLYAVQSGPGRPSRRPGPGPDRRRRISRRSRAGPPYQCRRPSREPCAGRNRQADRAGFVFGNRWNSVFELPGGDGGGCVVRFARDLSRLGPSGGHSGWSAQRSLCPLRGCHRACPAIERR